MTLPEAISIKDTWEMLENQSAVLVTVNRRLARYLKNHYNDRMIFSGSRVWETPHILPYDAWLEQLYGEAAVSWSASGRAGFKLLLSKAQERHAWEQVIRKWDGNQGRRLLQVPETARPAMEAWELCREWRIPPHELGQAPVDDTIAFLLWVEEFSRVCREKGWQDRAGLADAVIALMVSGHIKPPNQIILAGFNELSPSQMALVELMVKSGSRVAALSEPREIKTVRRFAARDAEAEMAAVAYWARTYLEINPDSLIGIVVPDLAARRASLIRHLDDALHPASVLFMDDSAPRAYNISLGCPLSEYPAARAMIQILNFLCRPLDVSQYSAFLRSPFLAGAESEISLRALLDARIREAGETELPLSILIDYAAGHDGSQKGKGCPLLHARLQSVQRLVQAHPDRQLPSGWVKCFQEAAKAMGWPGERTLTSAEYQTVEAFKEALSQFAAFDLVAGPMDLGSAIDECCRMLADTTFQPETGDAPIQVLGLLESAGERFSHLWVMGLDAETWPPAARPNPFLPVMIQRRYNVPHGSPEREFEFARRITDHLLGSAGEVVVSHPLADGDAELAPSPLIEGFEGVEDILVSDPALSFRMRIHQSRDMEPLIDQNGPEVGKDAHISGGTGLLKYQAACPFSAFATFRLGARPLETPEPGLNARERGTLIHKSLEFFWERIKTHAALMDLTQDALRDEIAQAVDQAVSEMAKHHPRAFTRIFTRLETQRLNALVLEWLALDRERAPFTVTDREKRLACTVGGVALNTFADRIDRLDDGRLVIVDYKTGEPNVQDWFSRRIKEPQLPLYSFAVREPLAGAVFGQLKKGKVKYLGVAEEEAVISGVSPPGAFSPDPQDPHAAPFAAMPEIIAFWRQKIEILAEEVRLGVAVAAPVSGLTTCRYCPLGPLCRIREAGFLENMQAEAKP
jgi:probable DNA repair protein